MAHQSTMLPFIYDGSNCLKRMKQDKICATNLKLLIVCIVFVLCSIVIVDAQYGNPFNQYRNRYTPANRFGRQRNPQSNDFRNGPRHGNRGGTSGSRKQNLNEGNKNIGSVDCITYEGIPGNCKPIATCFYEYGNLDEVYRNTCELGNNVPSVCCPINRHRPTRSVPFHYDPPIWPSIRLSISRRDVAIAVERTERVIQDFLSLESNFIRQGYFQRVNTMASIHQAVFGPPSQNLQSLNLNGFRALQVTRFLGKRFRLSPEEMRDGLSKFDMYGTKYERYCLPIPRCNRNDIYRTIDGSCNNLDNPLWGQSNTQFSRIMPPYYSDGISEFRESVNGRPLPLARVLSTELTTTSSRADHNTNVMFMQWGQFIDHDMTLGSNTRASNGQGLMCCNRTHLEDPVYHPACRPIIIPRRDPFYQRFNRRCNNFVRNAVGPKNNCNLGFREQTNVITSFLDASTVYGSEANRSSIVRTFRDGLLRVSEINRRQFLPYDTMNNSIACAVPRNMRLSGNAQRRCVFAGDVRVNQQFGILTLQLLFLREHNRLARQLKKINSHWNDEKLYQEARRIVGAEIQHITYNEWLPLALGRSVMNEAGLFPQQRGFCNGYDPQINPSIINEFAAAAFRWHSLVQGNYQLMDENGRVKQEFRMRNVFNNPALLYRDGAIDEATYGLLTNRAESFDPIFVDDLKNFLFPAANASFGMDLISINIQRGRDHGTPPYNQIRRACGLPIVRDFSDLDAFIRPGMAEKFAQIYDHVDDIDLFVGGVNEIPLSDGIVGPTFACVVAEQFRRLKYGDRFWYENGNMAHSFTEPQLQEIRKVTLSGIICHNGDRIKRIQPFSMIAKSRLNNNVGCDKIPQFNLKNWYDDDGYSRRG